MYRREANPKNIVLLIIFIEYILSISRFRKNACMVRYLLKGTTYDAIKSLFVKTLYLVFLSVFRSPS